MKWFFYRFWCRMTHRWRYNLHSIARFRKEFGVDLPIDGDHL